MKALNAIFLAIVIAGIAERSTASGSIFFTPYAVSTLVAPDGYTPTSYQAIPSGIAVDNGGNVYFSDVWMSRLIYMLPPGGPLTVIAGNASTIMDGTNTDAGFNSPTALAIDMSGNLYVADTSSSLIRKITHVGTNWVVTTAGTRTAGGFGIAGHNDGTNVVGQFDDPEGVAVDQNGVIYVADTGNRTIRMLVEDGTNWITSTIAGKAGISGIADGTNDTARFEYPEAIAVNAQGILYVVDNYTHVRQIAPVGTNWVVTTLFVVQNENEAPKNGTNSVTPIAIGNAAGITVDSVGNLFFASSYSLQRVTLSGTDWIGTTLALVNGLPTGIAVDAAGTLYFTDTRNRTITTARPALQYAVTNNQFVFSWPTTPPGGYMLQSSTRLGQGAVWSPLTNGIVTSGVDFTLTNAIDTSISEMFFRLARPPQ